MLLRLVLILALAAPVLAAQEAAKEEKATAPEVATLDADLSQLKKAFNEDAGEVRLLMILTPG